MLFSCRSRKENKKAGEAGLRMPQAPPLSASRVMRPFGMIFSSGPPGALRMRGFLKGHSTVVIGAGTPSTSSAVFSGSGYRIAPTTWLPEMLNHKLIPEM